MGQIIVARLVFGFVSRRTWFTRVEVKHPFYKHDGDLPLLSCNMRFNRSTDPHVHHGPRARQLRGCQRCSYSTCLISYHHYHSSHHGSHVHTKIVIVHTQCDWFTPRDVCFTPNAHRVDMSPNDSGDTLQTWFTPSRP
jgi:hypothetical protein